MPLNEDRLTQKFKTILNNPQTYSNVQIVSRALAKAVVEEVKLGTVIGSCPSGGGPLVNGKVQ